MAERTPCRRRRGLFFSLLGGLIRFLTGRIVGTGIVYVDLLKSTCARAVGSLAKSAHPALRYLLAAPALAHACQTWRERWELARCRPSLR